jgi:hypothetical protein
LETKIKICPKAFYIVIRDFRIVNARNENVPGWRLLNKQHPIPRIFVTILLIHCESGNKILRLCDSFDLLRVGCKESKPEAITIIVSDIVKLYCVCRLLVFWVNDHLRLILKVDIDSLLSALLVNLRHADSFVRDDVHSNLLY